MKTQPMGYLVLVMAAVAGDGAAVVAEEVETPARVVAVTGTATARVQPDLVVWSIHLRDTDPELNVAKKSNDERLAAALAIINRLQIAPEDVQTAFVSVSKEFERNPQGDQGAFKHYLVNRSITVRQRDLARFDEFFDALISQASAEVSFSLQSSSFEQLRVEARKRAVQAAREKANSMVTELGAQLGPVASVEEYVPENPWGGRQSYMSNASIVLPGQPTVDTSTGTLAPGALEVTVSVNARFAIVD